MKTTVTLLLLCVCVCTVGANAAPFTPASDAEIVEKLPFRVGPETRTARKQLARTPTDLPLALRASRDAIERGRRSGDPRELGNAQAALAPWWADPNAPAEVRLLRATIRQSQHDFSRALDELNALAASPANPLQVRAQAELTRSTVLAVLGRYPEAQAACEALAGPAFASLGAEVNIDARACIAELRSLQGHAAEAAAELNRLASEPGADGGWLDLMRAELAERRGDDGAAETLFRSAVARRQDIYTRAAFADWLLDRQRPADALALLGPDPDTDEADALLLRRAIALHHLKDPRAARAIDALQSRFDAARQRNDSLHAREEARFLLELKGDAAGALQLAQAQWAAQKEPADAVLLMRAARAASQPAAADPVKRFMRDSGLADARLTDRARKVPR